MSRYRRLDRDWAVAAAIVRFTPCIAPRHCGLRFLDLIWLAMADSAGAHACGQNDLATKVNRLRLCRCRYSAIPQAAFNARPQLVT